MKKIAPILLLSLLVSQSPSRGLTGGPFDNNQVPGGGADGTYSSVLTGENIIGTCTFGIGSYSGFEGNGRFAVFHEGAAHYGAVSGTADLASKRVAATLLGVAALPGETTGASGTTTNAQQTLTTRGSAEGAFDAAIHGYPQQIIFEGKGELSTTANSAVTIPGVTGAPINISLPDQPNTDSDNDGTQTFVTTPVSQDAVVRSTTTFRVRGSRTSTRPYQALNNFTATAPRAQPNPTATASATATP